MEKSPDTSMLPEFAITEEMVYEDPERRHEYFEDRIDYALSGGKIWMHTSFGADTGRVAVFWANGEQQGYVYEDSAGNCYAKGKWSWQAKHPRLKWVPPRNFEKAQRFLELQVETGSN